MVSDKIRKVQFKKTKVINVEKKYNSHLIMNKLVKSYRFFPNVYDKRRSTQKL